MKRSLITLAILAVLASPALGQTSSGTSNSGSYNNSNSGTTDTNARNNNTGTTNTSGTMNNTNGTDNGTATTNAATTTRHHRARRHHRTARMASRMHKKLPKTASPLPFVTLGGLGSLATGLWAGRRRRSQS